jgi:tRNA U34 2-thiouridine synthase MnmA/TrmU
MPYEGLENVLFPLASLTKEAVREVAKKRSCLLRKNRRVRIFVL